MSFSRIPEANLFSWQAWRMPSTSSAPPSSTSIIWKFRFMADTWQWLQDIIRGLPTSQGAVLLGLISKLITYCMIISSTGQFTRNIKGPSNILSSNRCYQLWSILLPRLCSFCSAPRIAISGQVLHWKSTIHGLPVPLHMLRVKSDKSDRVWFQSIVFTKPFRTRTSLDHARGCDSWCWPKGVQPLGTRMVMAFLNSPRAGNHIKKQTAAVSELYLIGSNNVGRLRSSALSCLSNN